MITAERINPGVLPRFFLKTLLIAIFLFQNVKMEFLNLLFCFFHTEIQANAAKEGGGFQECAALSAQENRRTSGQAGQPLLDWRHALLLRLRADAPPSAHSRRRSDQRDLFTFCIFFLAFLTCVHLYKKKNRQILY